MKIIQANTGDWTMASSAQFTGQEVSLVVLRCSWFSLTTGESSALWRGSKRACSEVSLSRSPGPSSNTASVGTEALINGGYGGEVILHLQVLNTTDK